MDYIRYARFSLHARDRIRERVGEEMELSFVSFVNHNPQACDEIFRGILGKKTRRKNKKRIIVHTAKKDLHVLIKYEGKYLVLIMDAADNVIVTVLGEQEYRCKSWAVNLSPCIEAYESAREVLGKSPSGVYGTCEEVNPQLNAKRLQEGELQVKFRKRVYKITFPNMEKSIWGFRDNKPAKLMRNICRAMSGVLEDVDEDVIVLLHTHESFLKKASQFYIAKEA